MAVAEAAQRLVDRLADAECACPHQECRSSCGVTSSADRPNGWLPWPSSPRRPPASSPPQPRTARSGSATSPPGLVTWSPWTPSVSASSPASGPSSPGSSPTTARRSPAGVHQPPPRARRPPAPHPAPVTQPQRGPRTLPRDRAPGVLPAGLPPPALRSPGRPQRPVPGLAPDLQHPPPQPRPLHARPHALCGQKAHLP